MPTTDLPGEIDLKIIGYLFEDARRNFVDIAKELHVSKKNVWNHYEKMKEAEIITGATIQINYKKIGYNCVASILLDVEPSQIEQVSSFLKEIPDVFGPYKIVSKYNLMAVVTLKTVNELSKINEYLRRKTGIIEINSGIWTDVWFTPENLTLIPIRSAKKQVEMTQQETIQNCVSDIDEVDSILIRHLSKDSRVSFRTLAKKLNLSADTVARRYKKLEKNNIIVPRIQIDLTKVGYQAITLFYLRVRQQYDLDVIVGEIIRLPDVYSVIKCMGDYDVRVSILVKSIQDMINIGEKISRIPGVKIMESGINPIRKWPLERTITSTLGR